MRPNNHKSLLKILSIIICLIFCTALIGLPAVFASAEDNSSDDDVTDVSSSHHVVVYDSGERLSVKSDATTVGELLERAGISVLDTDKVEPSLDTEINVDNFFINIYRSHPVLVVDSDVKSYIMTYSYDPVTIARNAGFEIYDGDTVTGVANSSFLELGSVAIYSIERGDGSTLTVEEEIPYEDLEVYDYSLSYGKSEVIQLGEVGKKQVVYSIKHVDGVEVERTLISETVIAEPVNRITRVGANTSGSTTATENENITWNYLIYQGFSPEQTAGIMGNLMQEHGFNTSDSSGGLGIAQWTGGRRNNLLSRDNPYEIYTQLDYLMYELNYSYPAVKAYLLAATSIDEATIIFQNKFERCGVCRQEKRLSYAYDIYSRHQK